MNALLSFIMDTLTALEAVASGQATFSDELEASFQALQHGQVWAG
jgi:hypothetical protein